MTRPSPSRTAAPRPRLLWLLALLAIVAAAVVAHWSALAAGFAFDDWDHLETIARWRTGELSLGNYLSEPYNEHWLPAWRLWYAATWGAFGLRPPAWHLAVLLAHGLGAACFALVLRAYAPPVAALFGATLWAIAGIGGWDNPLVWIPASHLTLAMAWLLAAMAAVAVTLRRPGYFGPLLMALCLSLAVLSMSAFWALLPAVAAQWWLCERRFGEPWLPERRWWVAWSLPFVVLAPLALHGLAISATTTPAAAVPAKNLGAGLVRTAAAWEITAERLLARNVPQPVPDIERRAATGLVLVVALLAWPGARRLCALVIGIALVYTLLVQAARSDAEVGYALSAGRYFYLTTWGWCGALAALLAAPWLTSTSRRRVALVTSLVLVGAWLTITQVRIARVAAAQFEDATRLSRFWFADAAELLDALAAQPAQGGDPLSIVDLTWRSPPAELSLRQYLALIGRPLPPALRWTTADLWQRADVDRLRAAFVATRRPLAWAWSDALEHQWRIAEVLLAWQRLAAQQNAVWPFPDIALTQGLVLYFGDGPPHPPRGNQDADFRRVEMSVPASVLARRLFGERLDRVKFVSPDSLAPADWRTVIGRLEKLDLEYARQLAAGLATSLDPPADAPPLR